MTRTPARLLILALLTALGLDGAVSAGAAGLDWPAGRLLPAFSTPAPVLDCVDLSSASGAEIDLFTSLEGIVNRTRPQIACVNPERKGGFPWLDLHQLHYSMTDGYGAVLKYRTNVAGLVVTDPKQIHTLNLATTIAGVNNELICDPSLLGTLTNAPYNFSIVDDLRGRFANSYEVYRYLYSNYWSRCTHRVFAGMNPKLHGHLRDYLIAVKSATVWLGPGKTKDAELLRLFVSQMTPVEGVYMGWWPGEGDGMEWIARFGIPVLASDLFCNATVFSGVDHPIRIPEIPPPPPLENKVYVALILSDGDNIQYMQNTMKRNWGSSVRGVIPIGWTCSPLAVDFDPMMLDYYWNTATTNDCLVSGPSGAGYAHINRWNSTNLAAFTRVSTPYLQRSGLRIITVWDNVTAPVAQSFAENCPTLLGLTDQGGTYNKVNLGLRTIGLTPTYTSSVAKMIAAITKAAARWKGKAPLFIAAQSDVWHLGPEGLRDVASALNTNKYKLVRPDHLFMLSNQSTKR